MLPSLTVSFIVGLLIGSQLPYFPCPLRSSSSSLRSAPSSLNDSIGTPSARHLGFTEHSWWELSIGV